ncbi:LysM peptidoglycan-binding domain-containing protein [Variovorax gossypii]
MTMPKLISATYHPNIEVAEFICEDGRHLLRSGGTLPWRINNPGDLTARMVDGVPAPKKAKGYVGFATTRSGRTFLIFPDEGSGRAELKANLKRMHGERTIPEAIPDYAPKHENNTGKYIDDLLRTSGIPTGRKINDCTEAEIEKIVDSISTIEGFHARPGTRKEIWVAVSRINATDGSQPIPDAEIILQRDGGEERLKSDATGRFPPVIHPADKSAIPVKVISPKAKEAVQVGSIGGETGKDFNLLAKFKKWKGVAGAEKINSSSPGNKKPVSHVIQPGDSLGKIAKLYRTSISSIKERNGLESDVIYTGDILMISGSGKKKSPARKPSPPAPSSIRPSDQERSKEGTGKVLALINPMPGRAPWMPIAIAEAKLRRGEVETTLQNKINYHTEIGDGLKSLEGRNNAWCAAFVNWCLMRAGYPIENAGYPDRKSDKARAHAFYEVDGPKGKSKKEVSKIRNPLFVELERPIYGAIAVETTRQGHGIHVGFIYAISKSGNPILLGGNQNQRINFSPFTSTTPEIQTPQDKKNKTIKSLKIPKNFKYFIPISYFEQSKKDLLAPGLELQDPDKLNESMNIENEKPKKSEKPSID